MSVQLLSSRPESKPIDTDDVDHDSGLNAVIERSIEATIAREKEDRKAIKERPRADENLDHDEKKAWDRQYLDKLIADGMEGNEAKAAEQESFELSRQHRVALREQYPSSTVAEVFDGFRKFHQEFQGDPAHAADAFAQVYKPELPYRATGDARAKSAQAEGVNKLDAVIEAAWDQQTNSDAEGLTAEQRAWVQKEFPGVKLHELMDRIVGIDQAAREDPLGVAARLAWNYGQPVTRSEQALAHVTPVFEAAAASLPNFNKPEYQEGITKILSDPRFPRTGNHLADIQEAYRGVDNFIRQQQVAQANKADELAKADRARGPSTPGTTPGGSIPSQSGGGIDGAISRSMRESWF